jgi:hypothetical protein
MQVLDLARDRNAGNGYLTKETIFSFSGKRRGADNFRPAQETLERRSGEI